MNVMAADAHSLRIQIETGQHEAEAAAATAATPEAVNANSTGKTTDPPLLYCAVFYKPKFGEWNRQIFPARGLHFLNLRGLACGQSYEVYSTCTNKIGTSAESVRHVGSPLNLAKI